MELHVRPGVHTQADWAHVGLFPVGEEMVELHAMVAILGCSRAPAVRFATDCTRRTSLERLVTCLDDLGGATHEVLTGRDTAFCVGSTSDGRAILAPEWVDLAGVLGVVPKACRPYRAKTKGKVERPIRYVRESFFYGRTFLNDADLNAQALSWLARTANVRIHRTTAEAPRTRFDREERVLLKPLALQPYQSVLLPSATQPTQPYYPLVASVERRPLAWYDRLTGVTP
jgi:transposase